jgi:hypothetical protein
MEQMERFKVDGTWYFETGRTRHRVEVYEHESRGNFGWLIFENDGGIYRLIAGDSRFSEGTFKPQATSAEALAAAEDYLKERLQGKGPLEKRIEKRNRG